MVDPESHSIRALRFQASFVLRFRVFIRVDSVPPKALPKTCRQEAEGDLSLQG